MSKHLVHMVDRPTLLEPAASGLVSEIVEVQIDGGELAA
jgi:hypothetical protein